jgi:glucose-6-phosphate 1-epimerase
VVWNPWIDKSKRLSQFDDDAWRRMFCVESANVMQDAVQLQAGESHTLEMRLELE